MEQIRPFSTGGNYVNFQLAEDDVNRTADAYRGTYERLRQIKARYDPDNLLRVNRSIRPSGPSTLQRHAPAGSHRTVRTSRH
ncbi:BBE domain-containing protein [Streptomyces cupreus]|uniref:BBE domain-containing protein n=1 Tax=Streptomyces cupreus TaxID=2759956 RepID=A0A7X1MBF7_9ACTN|nr:BBE domain-containing protein [Streptomyces cupreus]